VLAIDRGLWAVVADAPLERFGEGPLEAELRDVEAVSRHALAHATVIEFFFRQAAVIPLQLFTLFSGDESAVRHLRRRAAGMRTLLAQLRGLDEWAVRVTAGSAPASMQPRPASGLDYLKQKQALRDKGTKPSARALKEVTASLNALGRFATRFRKDAFPPPGKGRPFVAGASFLVQARQRASWARRVAATAAALEQQGHSLDVSGPWPPYHFAAAAGRGRRAS